MQHICCFLQLEKTKPKQNNIHNYSLIPTQNQWGSCNSLTLLFLLHQSIRINNYHHCDSQRVCLMSAMFCTLIINLIINFLVQIASRTHQKLYVTEHSSCKTKVQYWTCITQKFLFCCLVWHLQRAIAWTQGLNWSCISEHYALKYLCYSQIN